MQVVLISSGALPVFPLGYGGLEAVVGDLAVCLAEGGHEVTVICPDESGIEGFNYNIRTIKCGPCDPNARAWEAQAYQKYAPMLLSDDYKDAVIHDHTWAKGIYLLKRDNPRLNVMSTLHGMLPYQTPPPVAKPCMAGISKHHAGTMEAGLRIPVRFVYNGIDLSKYALPVGYSKTATLAMISSERRRYLFLARMTPFKGAHVFVDLMRSIQAEGDLVGDDIMVEDQNFVANLKQACAAYPDVKYWGGVDREKTVEFFQKAHCYILPCTEGWQEPFGLSVVEAMACGCPVVATASGAIPELVVEGVTGFVVKTTQDLQDVLKGGKIATIKSSDCRKRAEEFSREKMCEGYLKLYQEVLEGGW